MARTQLTIAGADFQINGQPTYTGRTWGGRRIDGLLLNSRMVQGIFDDLNPDTRARWRYPDDEWDADRNTDEFVAAMADWRKHGLLSFTINLQGGSPEGYSKAQPWINSAFAPDGSLREPYMKRLAKILDRADELGMAPIVGYFYFGQDERLTNDTAVTEATHNATAWLIERGYHNVIIEIANECDHPRYDHKLLHADHIHELIALAQKVCDHRYPVGASMMGGRIPPDNIVKASDLLLLHGNGVGKPDQIRDMVKRCRENFTGPIVFNEDDHFNFGKPDNHFIAAIDAHASWGFFDYRMKGEGFDAGYQSVPVNWGISSDRKRAFFELLAKITGSGGA